MIDRHDVKKEMVKGDKNILDLVNPTNKAFAILQYSGNLHKWHEISKHRCDVVIRITRPRRNVTVLENMDWRQGRASSRVGSPTRG